MCVRVYRVLHTNWCLYNSWHALPTHLPLLLEVLPHILDVPGERVSVAGDPRSAAGCWQDSRDPG